MLFCVPSGGLPRYARNDKVLRTDNNKRMGYIVCDARKGNLVIKPKTINAILSAFTNFRT